MEKKSIGKKIKARRGAGPKPGPAGKGKWSEERPWGKYQVLEETAHWKVKRIEVKPGERLSYQRHFRRREHWIIVRGQALVTLNGRDLPLLAGDSVDIPLKAAHRIANPGKVQLVFIEVQQGAYFGEDDIERLEDDYGRVGVRP